MTAGLRAQWRQCNPLSIAQAAEVPFGVQPASARVSFGVHVLARPRPALVSRCPVTEGGTAGRRHAGLDHARSISETSFVATIRRATAEDGAFLQEMLAVAADWRPDTRGRSVAELMGKPALAHYVAGWPADGDVGFVVEDNRPAGATWWRFFPEHDPGYGFVDDATPDVAIGIVAGARRQGLGTLLLEALIEE